MSAQEIKDLRLLLGLSYAKFAEAIGCRKATVIDWEFDRHPPRQVYINAMKRLSENKCK